MAAGRTSLPRPRLGYDRITIRLPVCQITPVSQPRGVCGANIVKYNIVKYNIVKYNIVKYNIVKANGTTQSPLQ
eukprot:9471510-Pyramimonas_sp.AAC.2